MRTFFNSFKIVIVLLWIVGFFVPEGKMFFWSFAAGWGAGTIMAEWYIAWLKNRLEKRYEKIVEVIDMKDPDSINNSSLPEDMKERISSFMESLKERSNKRCDNPHCKNCWNLSDNSEHKNEK